MTEAEYSIKQRHEMLEETQWANEFTWEELKNVAIYLSVSRVARDMDIFKA